MSAWRGLSLKGIVLGFLVDVCGTFVAAFGFGFFIVVVAVPLAYHAAHGDIPADEFMHAMMQNPIVLLAGGLLGLGCTALGGYVAGRIGRRAPLLNAGVMAILSEGLTAWLSSESAPLWFTVFGYAAAIPAALLGGWIASRVVTARATPPPLPHQ